MKSAQMARFDQIALRTNRRKFLRVGTASVAASWLGGSALATEKKDKSVFEATELNHISLDITHPQRSAEFYQALFGMTPISHGRGGVDAFLHFEEGFLNLRPADSAGMNHFCISIKQFSLDYAYTLLSLMELEPMVMGGGRLLHIFDPDGINVQIQEERHGWGRTADQLTNADKGVLKAIRLHHLALNVTNVPRSRDFYREMFGMATVGDEDNDRRCVLKIGQRSFLELHQAEKAGMQHYCYAVDQFDLKSAREKLIQFGVRPVDTAKPNVVAFRDPQELLVQVTSRGH